MKQRCGFVTNSSSSSYIIAFDKEPESVSDMMTALFGEKAHAKKRNCCEDVSEKDAAEYVFSAKRPIPSTPAEKAIAMISDTDEFAGACFYDEDEARKFIAAHPGKMLYVISLGNESGGGNVCYHLEYSGVFNRVPHYEESHH